MLACPPTRHPSQCPRHTMSGTSGCRMPSISASESWEGGGMHPRKRLRNTPQQVLRLQCLLSPIPPHLTGGQGLGPMKAKLPSLSCLGLVGTGAGTWAIASAHGTGPPLVPPVGPPAWPTFSLAVGSKALSLAPLGLGLSGLAPVSSPSLLLAAAGSGASHLWPLGSTALDRGSPGPIPAPSKVKRAKAPCWIFKFRGQPLWLIDK